MQHIMHQLSYFYRITVKPVICNVFLGELHQGETIMLKTYSTCIIWFMLNGTYVINCNFFFSCYICTHFEWTLGSGKSHVKFITISNIIHFAIFFVIYKTDRVEFNLIIYYVMLFEIKTVSLVHGKAFQFITHSL